MSYSKKRKKACKKSVKRINNIQKEIINFGRALKILALNHLTMSTVGMISASLSSCFFLSEATPSVSPVIVKNDIYILSLEGSEVTNERSRSLT